MNSSFKETIIKVLLLPVIIVVGVILSPLLLFFWLKFFYKERTLIKQFRKKCVSKDKHILFVHSESTIWKEYIEQNIIPKIEKNSIFLNWSDRAEWEEDKPLEAKILSHWGGYREFNPMAIIFLPSGEIKTVRFFKAFKEYKHGKTELLKQRESELYQYL